MQRLVILYRQVPTLLTREAHMKAKAIADVLYSNPQFRALLHDGSILARDLLSDVVEATATAIAPEEADLIELEEEATDVDGSTIKDDVENTKNQVRDKVDFAKTQAKQTYDQATSTAMKTLTAMQKEGQRFGEEIQSQASQAASSAKATADSLAETGTQKANQISSAVKENANKALAKLEEVTGITQEDLKKRLDDGISVEDIMQNLKSTAANAKEYAGTRLQEADQKGGKLLEDAKQSVNEFVEDHDLPERADDIIAQGKDTTKQAVNNAKDISQKAEKSAGETMDKAARKKDDLKAEAQKNMQAAKTSSEDAANKAARKTDDVASSATSTGDEVLSSSKQKLTGSRASSPNNGDESATNHLKAIGIVHTDAPQDNLATSSKDAQPDPKYMSEDFDSVEQASSQTSSVVQQVIAQIREKVKDVQGISEEDLKAAANDLISKTSNTAQSVSDKAKKSASQVGEAVDQNGDAIKQKATEVKGSVADTAAKGQKKAGELADEAKKSGAQAIDTAQEKGSEMTNQAREMAEDAKDTGRSAKDNAVAQGQAMLDSTRSKVDEISGRLQNIDQQDLQNAVNDLLRTTKQKMEQATGVKAEDARKSLDWAIQQGEELANQAMQNGRDGVETVKQKSSDAASVIKEKSAVAGRAIEDTAVTVGAQTKHVVQNARRDAPGQVHDTLDASRELMDTAVSAVKESTVEIRQYLSQKFPPKRRAAIRKHFQGLAVALRDNTDYSNGLDGLISTARKYVDYTLTFTEELPNDPSEVVSTNAELDKAVLSTIKLIERFSNGVGFSGVQKSYSKLKKDMQKEKGSEDFLHDCMTYFKKIVQDLKYAASEDAERHGQQLLQRVDSFTEDTGFKQHANELIQEVVRLAEGFASDKALFHFIHRGQTLFKHLVMNEYGNFVFKKRVMKDFLNIIIPSTLKLVQYVPISRIEFQNADVDVLIENLVFESSSNHDQSFLPYRLKIDNHNSLEFLNAYKLESDYSNQITVKVEGLTMAVRDAGFYIRKKTGFWRFVDSGLLDLVMDGKGIDIDIDIQMSTDDEDADVTKDALFIVKDVRVNIHKLDFSTSGSKHGWLIGLVKPFIRGFVKRQVGLAIGEAMKEQLEYYEYQLRMLQHRIKTAYIANNGQASFESFFRAIFTANAGNNPGRKGQFEIAVGRPGPLAGIFTKASLQQELEEADTIAAEHGRPHSWRNDIFDLGV